MMSSRKKPHPYSRFIFHSKDTPKATRQNIDQSFRDKKTGPRLDLQSVISLAN